MAQDILPFLEKFYEALNTPRSLSLYLMLKYKDFDVRLLETPPETYLTGYKLYLDRLACDVIRKSDYLVITGIDRERAALERFQESENMCAEQNTFMLNIEFADTRSQALAAMVRAEMHKLFRPLDLDSLGRFGYFGGFGPGATLSNKRKQSSVLQKLLTKPTATASCAHMISHMRLRGYGYEALNRTHNRDCRRIHEVTACRLNTVPKNFKTDRTICIEPLVNAYVQRAIGLWTKRRLFHVFGIDIDKAPVYHREVAKQGSVDQSFATIDLSMASDTISYEVVRYLLPEEAFTLFESARSPRVERDGGEYPLEKFSSMGNGYTFELETAIFASIARVACRLSDSPMYYGKSFGDDIIIPREATTCLLEILDLFGFKINIEKSFYNQVPFRESCGGDYYQGVQINGFYLKEIPREPQDWFALANKIYDHIDRVPSLRSVHSWVIRRLPSNLRKIRGPARYGDSVIREDDRTKHFKRVRNSIVWQRVLIPYPRIHRMNPRGDDEGIACLYASLLTYDRVTRTSVSGYRVRWLPDS